MSSDQSFVEFVVDQMSDAGSITFRKMFGEYCVYCDTKVVALICNNKLFVKPTQSGRAFIGAGLVEARAYPKAKPSFLVEDRVEDRDWLSRLIKITASELPIPKKRRRRVT